MRVWLALSIAVSLFGCGSPPGPTPVAQTTSSPSSSAGGGKRIVEDGAGGYLPDGTRVAADERGGFRLPNGDYVTALATGLLLPNGTQCPADGAGGYVCP